MSEFEGRKVLEVSIVYSEQAQKLISNLKDFDINVFEKDYIQNKVIIGDRAILEYIFSKRSA